MLATTAPRFPASHCPLTLNEAVDLTSLFQSNRQVRAAVKVNTDGRTGKIKYASAHDLHRSFGERWAARVMPQILMQLMRHEAIETTMRYYVAQNVEINGDVSFGADAGNTSGNFRPIAAESIDVTQ